MRDEMRHNIGLCRLQSADDAFILSPDMICNPDFILFVPPGVLLCPWVCLVMAIGLSALILGLWPMHLIWTYYCIIRYSACFAVPFLSTSFNY
jgi:hypothetical protein